MEFTAPAASRLSVPCFHGSEFCISPSFLYRGPRHQCFSQLLLDSQTILFSLIFGLPDLSLFFAYFEFCTLDPRTAELDRYRALLPLMLELACQIDLLFSVQIANASE